VGGEGKNMGAGGQEKIGLSSKWGLEGKDPIDASKTPGAAHDE